MVKLTVKENMTLKKFTDDNYPQGSFFFSYLLKNKEIKVNGVKVGKDMPVNAGDVVEYFLKKNQEEKTAYKVLYKDENVLVVDKESGVNSEAVFNSLFRKSPCYFIHRLDRNTEGVMIFSKTTEAETELKRLFKTRNVEKEYETIVVGTPKEKHAVLTAYLKKDASSSLVKIFSSPVPDSEKIVTEYEVVAEKDGFSKLLVKLHTGKTHQIRAHFAFLGHPVLGDQKYGNGEANRLKNKTRQMLVSKKLCVLTDGKLSYLKNHPFVSEHTLEL